MKTLQKFVSIGRLTRLPKVKRLTYHITLVVMAVLYSQLLLQAQNVNYVTIDPPGSTLAEPTAIDGINVVGYYDDTTGMHGFLYNGATFSTINGPSSEDYLTSAVGVSGSNVVGTCNINPLLQGSFLYNGIGYITLNVPSSSKTIAQGVSGSNIVGYYINSTENGELGFLYNGSTYTSLDPSGKGNYAEAIGVSGNNVVGQYYDGERHSGFLYSGGAYSTLDAPDSVDTYPTSISSNDVAGYYYDGKTDHGFVYTSGAYVILDPPGSVATIPTTASGNKVAGYYDDGTTDHGFVYSGGAYIILDPPGSIRTHVTGISGNNVTGYYVDSNNITHGFFASIVFAPVIASTGPNPVIGSNSPQAFTINGSGFLSGCNVTLTDLTANQSFPNRTISSFSSTQIVINPNFTTSAHSWSVQVTNPNGGTTSPYDFNVVASINSWISRVSGTTNNLFGIVSGNGTAVAVGANGTILTSQDGITWTNQISGTTNELVSVAYGDGIFVAVGANGTILTSPDGITWTSRVSGTNTAIQGIAYGNGFFVAITRISSMISLKSPDGINWSIGTLTSAFPPVSIAFVDNRFLANAGYFYTSPNGTTWTRSASTSTTNINGFAYGNDTLVSAGVGANISTSPDGINWTSQTSGTSNELLNVTYGNGFVATGASGTILSSTDGVTWTGGTSDTSNNLNAAVYFSGTFLIVGNNGSILQSNSVPESGPLITEVSPNPVPTQSGAQTLTIDGSNFAAGSTVTLVNLGTGLPFPNLIPTSQSSTQLTLSQNFGTTPATWTVEVINSVGASSGQYMFQVGTGVTPTFSVTATNGTTFAPVQLGSSSTPLTFILTNNSTTAINGSATVTGPFNIKGTATYKLQAGQFQTFTVQFTPTGTSPQTGNLRFSGGTGATIQLSGSAIAPPIFASITGTVINSSGSPVPGAFVSALGDSNSVSTAPNGTFALTGLAPSSSVTLSINAPDASLIGKSIPNITVLSDHPTNIGIIKLDSIPMIIDQTKMLPKNIPVVLVRGLGPEITPGTPDNYWSGNGSGIALNATPLGPLALNFTYVWDPNANGTVIDGTKSIDYNSSALVTYITNQVEAYYAQNSFYPPYINIVAHSMGGLIVREALNNKPFIVCNINNACVPITVKYVVMLAPPNEGSPLANLALEVSPLGAVDAALNLDSATRNLLANNFGGFGEAPVWDSTICLTTDNVLLFNDKYQVPSKVTCFLLAGTGGGTSSSPALQIGSDLITVKAYLNLSLAEIVNDGVVTRPSVSGNYYLSFLPISSVDMGPHDITDHQALGEYLDHLSMITDSGAQNWIIRILQTGNLPANQTQAIKTLSLSANENPKAASVYATTLTTVQCSNLVGNLAQGSNIKLSVACDAATVFTLNLLTSSKGTNFTLLDPSGNSINSTSGQDNNVAYTQIADPISGIVSTTYTITSPAQGTWTVMLDGTGLTQSSIGYHLFTSGDSSVALQSTTASYFHNNSEAVLSCTLLNTGTTPPMPVSATSVTTQIVYPDGTVNSQTLFDDGFHGDDAANDGVYGAILSNVTEPGQYYVTYSVTGSYPLKKSFTRYATSVFTVSSEDASIAGNLSSQPANVNTNGAAQSICVKCWVNATVPGTYLLSGLLTDSTGTLQIPASVRMDNTPVGTSTATLYFDTSTFQQAGFTGMAILTDLQLSEETSTSLQWLDAYPNSFSIQIGPQITIQPNNISVIVGGSTELSVSVIGDAMTSFQWLYNGSPISGQTTATLPLSNVTLAQAGNYSVVVTDETGSVTSSNATLNVQALTTFSDWATTNAVSSNPLATPLNDGVPNLLKYLYDINPSQPMSTSDRAALPSLGCDTTTTPGIEYLTLTYRENPFMTGLTANVQTSTDLQTWTTVNPPDFSEQIGNDLTTGDPIMELGVKIIPGATKQFVRLHVIQP